MATINIVNYKIGFTDQFFFDTNIWLLLFGNIANYRTKDQKEYSSFFKETLNKQTPIFISSLVLSEFANVLLRSEFKNWKAKNNFSALKDFKRDFSVTIEYSNCVKSSKESIKSILNLPNIHLISDFFNGINTESVLGNFDFVDFNDAYLIELSKGKYKIVTNDKDFQKLDGSVDIITTQIA